MSRVIAPPWELPYLDREEADLDVTQLDRDQQFFRENGYLVPEERISPQVLANYQKDPEKLETVRNMLLYQDLWLMIEKLYGDKMGLLGFTPAKVTDFKEWMQPKGKEWNATVLIALHIVDVEVIPKSHKMGKLHTDNLSSRIAYEGEELEAKDIKLPTGAFIILHSNVLFKAVQKKYPANQFLVGMYLGASTDIDLIPVEYLTGGTYFQNNSFKQRHTI